MPTEILPGIYDITCRQVNGRRYRAFLSTDDVPVLFDTGFENTMPALFEGIDTIGTEPERLVITHGHADHSAGFDTVVQRYGTETWVPTEIELHTNNEPDHHYEGGDTIGRFEAVHVPGHSPGNSALIDETEGVAILGDTVFGSDLRGLPPGYPVLPPEIYSDDINQAERSLDKLLHYKFETGLIYHGEPLIKNACQKIERFVNFPGKPERNG